ncbi:thymidylate kinase [Streptomyces sp. H34-S4]|uniref:thymidylate kinase n=1 Tax=Streptomyces sp. H34-S4 TaxID=2996463 RepID=UPI00226D9E49|nr:thymidylate kinase [Streptomyces sp. H34-S4]MCY0935971.1 thymidylate kinase [Streptomyces sp. H34-S4]
MTTATHPCTRGPLISGEGINGVGKTYLTQRAVAETTEHGWQAPVLLDEFSERARGRVGLGGALLDALVSASNRDPFLRGGTPATEAMLLFAIKAHDLDTVRPHLVSGRAVIEGRSIDTTAVYQALLLHPDDADAALEEAGALLRLAASFRALPDLTILVTDDASAAIARAQTRDQRIYPPDQLDLQHAACSLYERLAATDPVRFRVLDRREVGEEEAVSLIGTWIREAYGRLPCLAEPWQDLPASCQACGTGA